MLLDDLFTRRQNRRASGLISLIADQIEYPAPLVVQRPDRPATSVGHRTLS